MNALALILGLATLLHAADTPVAPVDIHPLLLGSLSDRSAPISTQLDVQAKALVDLHGDAMTMEAASRYLLPLMQGSPQQQAAAGVLAAVITRPEVSEAYFKANPSLRGTALAKVRSKAPTAPGRGAAPSAYESLIAAAARDGLAARYFNGTPEPPLELDGMAMTRDGIVLEGRRLDNLGAGGFGMVDAHPKVEGAVIKTPYELPGMPARANAAVDEATSRALSKAGVGPNVLAVTDVLGSPIIIKERVYGQTVADLIEKGRFGAAEHSLVVDMLGLLAGARLRSDDMRGPNIMIGTTRLNPARRAYFVDGGNLSASSSRLPRLWTRAALYCQETILDWWDEGGERYFIKRPFRHILEQGLVKSGAASWLLRAKVAVLEKIYSLSDPRKPAQTPVGSATFRDSDRP